MLFEDNGLGGVLYSVNDHSPFLVIDEAYSGKFKREDFRSYNLEGTKLLNGLRKLGLDKSDIW